VREAGVRILLAGLVVLCPAFVHAQQAKEINEQAQFWWSLNNTLRVTDRLGAVADVHIRRTDFMAEPSFYFVRAGFQYWVNEQLTVVAGYAHMWQAPAEPDWSTWTQEDRIYQQLQYVSRVGKVALLSRLRSEQRFRDEVVNDQLTGERQFTDRVRFLFSATVPVSPNPNVPSLVFSDEILVQFGEAVVNNTFDQNRLFLGIKKNLKPSLSFDLGYMMVYQQKASGYQYDLNNTFRWFFYYTADFRRSRHRAESEPAEPADGSE
jgi:hypothetical protein